MPFKVAKSLTSIKFNSAASSELLGNYLFAASKEIQDKNSQPKSKTFAPSSFRCKRLNWFRLRGVDPDKVDNPDLGLDFTAKMGTACHEMIQSRLQTTDLWVEPFDYIKSVLGDDCEIEQAGYECRVSVKSTPVNFACDGIVELKGEKYLLEIKSCEHSTFEDMSEPRPYHIDQVKCYGTLLQLHKVLFMYIDRQYGEVKCFEYRLTTKDIQDVQDTFRIVIECVDKNIAPEALPSGDRNCTSNMCPYYHKCKEWGR